MKPEAVPMVNCGDGHPRDAEVPANSRVDFVLRGTFSDEREVCAPRTAPECR
jgi:hypothetical protein